MTIEADILTMLEDRELLHRIDIIGELKHHNAGSVDATLSAMFKRGKLTREGSVYSLPNKDAPAWKDPKAPAAARIVAFLQKRGMAAHRTALAKEMPDIKQLPKVLADMIQGGHIHSIGDGQVGLGPHPGASGSKSQGHWSRGIPPRDLPPKTPAKQEAQRSTVAAVASTKPAAIATPTPVADEHNEKALGTESPPAEMGPSAASVGIAQVEGSEFERQTVTTVATSDEGPEPGPYPHWMDEKSRQARKMLDAINDVYSGERTIPITPSEKFIGLRDVCSDARPTEDEAPEVMFRISTDDLNIEISGTGPVAYASARAVMDILDEHAAASKAAFSAG